MTLRRRVATWLLVRDSEGGAYPPGSRLGVACVESDGTHVALVARGPDAWDLYHGREAITAVPLSGRAARRLAWAVLWTWWLRGLWCGLKSRLWRWAAADLPAATPSGDTPHAPSDWIPPPRRARRFARP